MGLFDLFKPVWQSDDKEKALKTVDKETDQLKLSEIAQKAILSVVRLSAAEKLDGQRQVLAQEVFADIAKNDKNENIRIDAAKKLDEKYQTVFAYIAINYTGFYSEYLTLGDVAMKKLTDIRLLSEVATNARSYYMRLLAIEKLDFSQNQILFAHIAKNDKHRVVRKEVFDKLDQLQHQTLFADIAKNDEDAGQRIGAIKKLDEQQQALFADIAKNDKHEEVRRAAVEKLTDQTILVEVAKNDDSYAGSDATEKIIEQSVLIYVARYAKGEKARSTAIKKLDKQHQVLFAEFGIHDECPAIRSMAIKELNEQYQELFANFAKKRDEQDYVRLTAVKKLTNQILLADVAKNANLWKVRKAAIEKLTDQRLLAEVAKDDIIERISEEYESEHGYMIRAEIGMIAVGKLFDKNLLANIAENAEHEKVREAAEKRLTDIKTDR